ncbi:MAG: hypothetical protein LBH66_00770 [Oscillospiraceae bacterium]|nr:hypothetical protein [Oscillospiraceae bacterium]
MLTEEFKVEDFIKSWHAHWLAEGREEGRIEGLEEGRIEGIRLGKEKSKRDIAHRLLKAGYDIDKIVGVTDVRKEEILSLLLAQ